VKNVVTAAALALALLLLPACASQASGPDGGPAPDRDGPRATAAEGNAPGDAGPEASAVEGAEPEASEPEESESEESEPEESGSRFGETAGGAVAVVESEEEGGGRFTSMADMLRGRVAGLQVIEGANGDISLRIRGLSKSFMGNEEPLLVVDGVPMPTFNMSNTLRTIDPSDVASIHVLKDVASTSAYGIRGANGVIVIRLKRR
jgi:TonB-dependent SusC/RagA subfamily outer membrane receptor